MYQTGDLMRAAYAAAQQRFRDGAWRLDEETGHITGRNGKRIGHQTGRRRFVGVYVQGKVLSLREHRVIVEAMTGEPISDPMEVDHVNGDPADNRPVNLELVDGPENLRRAAELRSRQGSAA